MQSLISLISNDYNGVVTSIDPHGFGLWLQEHFGARLISQDDKCICTIDGIGTWKIVPASSHITRPEENHIPLLVSEPITKDLLNRFEDIDAYAIRGQDHWRILEVRVTGHVMLGCIHIAHRVRPLGH